MSLISVLTLLQYALANMFTQYMAAYGATVVVPNPVTLQPGFPCWTVELHMNVAFLSLTLHTSTSKA